MTKSKQHAPNPSDPYALYTREEAAAFLRINIATVSKLTTSGRLGSVRVGGRKMMVPRAALEAYIRGESGLSTGDYWPPTPSMFNEQGEAAQ